MSTVAAPEAPAITRPVTNADVLERAADLLEEFGWCQGAMALDSDGCVTTDTSVASQFCVGGAVLRAIFELRHDPGPVFGVSSAPNWLDRMLDLTCAAYWNDDPGRTRTEVVARLRKAVRRARQPD